MTPFSAVLLAAMLVPTANSDSRSYSACRAAAHVVRGGGCGWRAGSLFAVNGQNSTRIAFRSGRPAEVMIHQPGVSGPEDFIPASVQKFPLHIADMSAVDGNYLVCALRHRPNPYDVTKTMDVACLAGARHLRAGTVAWIFSDAPKVRRPLRRP